MPIAEKIVHIFEPNPLACGQAVIAMISGRSVESIIELCGTDRETKLCDMKRVFGVLGINLDSNRVAIQSKEQLPDTALLSLETPHCWHWSLYHNGTFYDPEYGILDDFPPSKRRYYFKITSL